MNQEGDTRAESWRDLWRMRRYTRPYLRSLIAMGVFAVVGIASTVVIPLVVQRFIDGPLADRSMRGIVALSLLMLGLALLDTVCHGLLRFNQGRIGAAIERDVRRDMFHHLLRLPADFYSRWDAGALVTRLSEDVKAVRRFGNFGLVFLFVNTATFVLLIAVLLGLYWPLGLVVIVGLIPVFFLSTWFESRYGPVTDEVQEHNDDVTSAVEEAVTGVSLIKAYGQAGRLGDAFGGLVARLRGASIRQGNLYATAVAAYTFIPTLVLVVVLVAGSFAVANGALTIGELVAFAMLTTTFVWPLDLMGYILSLMREAATSSRRLFQLFDAAPSVTPGSRELTEVRGELAFRNVAFSYGDNQVLRDVTLTIKPGETVALVGAPGAGKSVLTALVPRFFDVDSGQVAIDGNDIRELTFASLRSIVACTFEDPTLFSASVRENVTFGRPDATDDEVAAALAVAHVDYVDDLPDGLDTRIGEQGISLSGGQRQRLALARAVLTKPAILVLDDPLSALDVHTEAAVEHALRTVLAGTTALLVARRPSTVALADRVAVLAGGKIVATGTHSELLATVPSYAAAMGASEEVNSNV